MPSQPKIDLKIDPAKRRSQISRRVDNSFPVFAPLVWHAGHADGELVWLPSMLGMKLLSPARLILMFASASHIIAKYILGNLKLQVSCLAINADYNKKSHVCHNVSNGIDWQN